MFDNILKIFKAGRSRGVPPVDPRVFNDHVAIKTQWTPLVGGGATFRSHTVVRGRDTLCFEPTLSSYLCVAAFFVPGIVMIGLGTHHIMAQSQDFEDSLGLLAFGLIFTVASVFISTFVCHRASFDRKKGLFHRGLVFNKTANNLRKSKNCCALREVHALQIIEEHVTSDDSSYLSYELNLVLRNGQRINVIDHSNLSMLRKDAAKVSQFLECPLWDATDLSIHDYA